MRVTVSVEGGSDLLDFIDRLGPAGEKAGKDALAKVTAKMVAAIKPMTPVEPEDGGSLRDSVRALRPTRTRDGGISAGVIAGGDPLKRHLAATHHDPERAEVYAFIQHEDLSQKHTQGEGKFVEKGVLRHQDEVPTAVMDALERVAR